MTLRIDAKDVQALTQLQQRHQALGQLCYIVCTLGKAHKPLTPECVTEDHAIELKAQLGKYFKTRCSPTCNGYGCPNHALIDAIETMQPMTLVNMALAAVTIGDS